MTEIKIDKPIRLIELFSGIGCQAMALRNIGADFDVWRTCEWDVNAIKSYKAIHKPDDHFDYSFGMTKSKLIEDLALLGISNNGKKPMDIKQIGRKSEKWLRETYNNCVSIGNLVDISNTKGEDLDIEDTDRYTYIMTYSFPCQDISIAGRLKGMRKGSGTRSGMLWEVERILGELDELPQILLMENVPQVHSNRNAKEFGSWCEFLRSKGYTNFWQDMNSKNYGIAQNRNRTFMVSILGDYSYSFPKIIPLTKIMKDYLEPEVDEKFYVNSEKADRLIEKLLNDGVLPEDNEDGKEEKK